MLMPVIVMTFTVKWKLLGFCLVFYICFVGMCNEVGVKTDNVFWLQK